jgi:hypothetical protein
MAWKGVWKTRFKIAPRLTPFASFASTRRWFDAGAQLRALKTIGTATQSLYKVVKGARIGHAQSPLNNLFTIAVENGNLGSSKD